MLVVGLFIYGIIGAQEVKNITLEEALSLVISEFILNAAKAKLSSTRKPINVIARELQFSDQYSFSHFFKKHEGLSPSQYRNQF